MIQLMLTLRTLTLGVVLFQPLSLLAQDSYHGGALDARQHGFEHGYRDGFAFGQDASVSNRDQDIVNQKLRAADKDYQSAFGSQESYRQGYGEGFRAGMDDSRAGNRSRLEELFRPKDRGYDPDQRRDDRIDAIYPQNHWSAAHIAQDFGYRDGLESGIRDRMDGRGFKPRRHNAYQNGLHGFEGAGGRKADYVRGYRAAYLNGYQIGFGSSR